MICTNCVHAGNCKETPYRDAWCGDYRYAGKPANVPHIPCREDIPIGRENAIRREALEALWDMPDRQVRKTVERFRETDTDDPYPILSTSHGAGYWRSNDQEELEHYYNEMSVKARKHFLAAREAKRALNKIYTEGQVTIEALLEGKTA